MTGRISYIGYIFLVRKLALHITHDHARLTGTTIPHDCFISNLLPKGGSVTHKFNRLHVVPKALRGRKAHEVVDCMVLLKLVFALGAWE